MRPSLPFAKPSLLPLPPLTSRNPPPPASNGEAVARLGNYELMEEFAWGGMTRIYKARSLNTDRTVALKLIRNIEPGGAAFERFRKEAEAAARLRHPNIVQLYEVGEYEGQPFLALEFCAGGTLAHKLRGGALPPSEAAELVETLAQAVDAIHQQGILHRDLKPSNVLLTVEGQLKIADFCLADTFVEAALTETGTILGTPAYMAPELASGKHHLVGRGTDIYSLGAILYECLTGQRPFVGATMLEMIQRVIDTEPIPPSRVRPAIPHALEIICLKCLHKDPRQRYATAAELAADLRRFREEQALGEDRAVSTSSRSGFFLRWLRRLWPNRSATRSAVAEPMAHEALAEDDLLAAAFGDLSEAVFLFDSTCRLVLVNASARRLLGWKDATPLNAADLPPELIEIQARIRQGEKIQEVEIFLCPPRRSEGVWVSLTGRSLSVGAAGFVLLAAGDQNERRALRFGVAVSFVGRCSADVRLSQGRGGMLHLRQRPLLRNRGQSAGRSAGPNRFRHFHSGIGGEISSDRSAAAGDGKRGR